MIKRVLVLLLALCTIAALASCGKTPEVEPTEPVVNTDGYTTEAPPETDPPESTTGPEEPTDEPTSVDPSTILPTTMLPTGVGETTTAAAAADPTAMNKEQLVKYYNDAVNAVRAAKPAYTRTEVLKINSLKTSLVGGLLDGLLNSVVKNQMPGDPKTTSRKKGEGNADHFFIEQQVSSVKNGDVASISAKKEGANYVVTLTVGSEVNPKKAGASKYSRLFQMQTRQELLDSLASDGLTAAVDNTTLTYHDGSVRITVNDKGQIVKASAGFFVDASAKQAKLSIFTFDLTAYQQSTWEYTGFAY
jgi:predicted small lipoprotein YifL